MNSNNINDIYIDEEKRIWIANYPEGITIIDNRYKNYNWIKHSIGNRQSLVNDQVHLSLKTVMETYGSEQVTESAFINRKPGSGIHS